MRLPSVPLAFAAGVLLHICAAAPAARAAAPNEPTAVSSCADFGAPAPADAVRPVPSAARPAPVPTPLDAEGLAAEETYRDVFRILSTPNRCSDFFGGPARAAQVFNHFSRVLKRAPLDDPKVALRMWGTYSRHRDTPTGASYRLFEQATINSAGPLAGGSAPLRVGRYPGNTPQARALVLLHELGHLVEGPAGGWLLPNDGRDAEASARNTRLVEAHCGEQLEAIRGQGRARGAAAGLSPRD